MTEAKFTKLAWSVLAYNLIVAMWGAYVRATGAGAGCGDHWPTCKGEFIPRSMELNTLIEYSHRVTSGLALISVILLIWFAFKVYEKGHRVRSGASWTLFLILVEATLGAGLVLLELVADDVSMARVFAMGIHLANTLLLFAAMSLTAWWAQGGQLPDLNSNPKVKRLMGGILTLLILVGVSGAVTALGDTLFHPGSLQAMTGEEPFAEVFLRKLRFVHPIMAVTVALLLISLAVNLKSNTDSHTQFWSKMAITLTVVQLLAGTLNIILKVPVWLQLIHLLLAYGVWISAVLLGNSALSAEED